MKELSRSNLFKFLKLKLNKKDNDEFLLLLQINIDIIKNIEEKFSVIEHENKEDDFEFDIILNQNILDVEENLNQYKHLEQYNNKSKIEFKKISRLLDKIKKEIINTKSNYGDINLYKFNRVLKLLMEFNNSFFKIKNYSSFDIEELLLDFRNDVDDGNGNSEEKKLVNGFLSYAYDDKLYTLSLYLYFHLNGIKLYVDWIHNREQSSGFVLKNILNNALEESKYFIFLRSINSELNINGKNYVRPWCSWEMGNFYNENQPRILGKKYLINLYDLNLHDLYINNNMQLHGFYILERVDNGTLYGTKIIE